MTRLLVSVRDADEAAAALGGGADLIDLKEPNAGSLGAVDPRLWDDVRKAVGPVVPTSVALGEFSDLRAPQLARRAHGFQFAKLGLAGASHQSDWSARWRAVLDELPDTVRPVAVVYADFPAAGAPEPDEVLRLAVQFRCAAVLIDTFVKDGRSVFSHWPAASLGAFGVRARDEGLLIVIGGALDATGIAVARRLSPDYVAVRGAVCRGGRTGKLDERLVAELSALVRQPTAVDAVAAT